MTVGSENGKRVWPAAVIFDMDGLMFGTEQQIQRTWDLVGPEAAGEPMGYNLYHTMGMSRASRIAYFYEKYGKDFPYEDFEKKYRAKLAEIKAAEGVPVKEGLFALMEYLHDAGIPMVLATGSGRENTMHNLRITGTPDYFAFIITGDMVKVAKPDPYIYRLTCEKLGVEPSEVLVLEDSRNGVRAAYAAGTPVIMIPDIQKDTTPVDGMYTEKFDTLAQVIPYLEEKRKQ